MKSSQGLRGLSELCENPTQSMFLSESCKSCQCGQPLERFEMRVGSRLLLMTAIICSVLTPAPGNSQEAASLVFDTNNGTGGPDPVTRAPFSSVLVPSGEPTRSGSSFQGWYTNPDGTGTWHGAGSSATLPAAGDQCSKKKVGSGVM